MSIFFTKNKAKYHCWPVLLAEIERSTTEVPLLADFRQITVLGR